MFLYQADALLGSAANAATSSRGRSISISVATSTAINEVSHDRPVPYCAARKLEIPDLRGAIDDFQPDALVIDISTFGAAAVAETGPLSWVQYLPYFTPIRSNHAPPFGLSLQPRSDWTGRIRDAILETVALRPQMRESIEHANRMRASVGAPPLRDHTELYRRAPLFRYYTAESLNIRAADWPPNYRLVGPGLWEPPTRLHPGWKKSIAR
jgi:hypothetical protein